MKQGDEDREEFEILAGASFQHEQMDLGERMSSIPSNEDVIEDIQQFIDQHGLSNEKEYFQKAAILIQGETPIERIPGINDTELKAVKNETHRKWHQPKLMYLTIVATALGSMGQGWAQTGINGANITFPDTFGVGSDSSHDNFVVGLINCGIYLSNGLIGCWLVAPLNNRLGRRGAVFAAAVVSCLSNIGCAVTANWQQLLVFRLLLGCALGVISSTLNVFAAECAPAAIRGGLAGQYSSEFELEPGLTANSLVADVLCVRYIHRLRN